ncbi:sigma-E factor negative regulatory protein RseC [Abyssogena phaseoliformis symbiont OG214]|uniref:SoxR reducing system RseC family protein n=1 Tax=Abyssogena phaseoliformis symbiont TaxID=596095 RepID=UPI001915A93F|nr:SoxR reducing system RseC family protein [Abyssogena phaseoliformis symbiont]MBW5289142.1 Sigma factor RpoE regulatory protein RseC [Candidatus Ruthia sp. Apha_13_S6]BBB22530.1 sigma-E factor negative regulatory protein RseC [Abyssogena phaseoliformis symbiont OG214]
MKEQFEVIEIDNEMMTLKANQTGGCHSCEASSGCGTGILANYFNHYSVFNKPYQSGVSVGDFVTLEISSSELFLRAFTLYIAPILALFLGGAIGVALFPQQEFWHILFSGIGFIAALFSCRWFFK